MEKKEHLSQVELEPTQKEALEEATSENVLGVLKSVTMTPLGGVGDENHSLTGSGTMIKIRRSTGKDSRILLDFGVHVGKNSCKLNKEIPFNPSKVDVMVATHAHLDHVGRFPMLVSGKNPFKGRLYASNVTKALMSHMLMDSAKVMANKAEEVREKADKKEKQLMDAMRKIGRLKKLLKPSKKDKKDKGFRKNHARIEKHRAKYNSESEIQEEINNAKRLLDEEGVKDRGSLHEKFGAIKEAEDEKVLYTEDEVRLLDSMVRGKKYREQVEILPGVKLTFLKAAHVMGSSQVVLEIDDGEGGSYNMGFSGDLGRYDKYNNLGEPDHKIDEIMGEDFSFDSYQIESTYGGKPDHPDREEEIQRMAAIINHISENNGKILIPAFMLQRVQDTLATLLDMKKRKLIPQYLPLYYDGVAVDYINNVFTSYDLKDQFYSKVFSEESGIIKPTKEDNAFLREDGRTGVMVVPSGMLAGGKVLSYMPKICPNPKNAMFFVGYQAEGTLGHQIATEGYKHIFLGEEKSLSIRSQIHIFKSFSSHADEMDLLHHLEMLPFKKDASIFLNHGDVNTSQKMLEAAIREYEVVSPDVAENIKQPRVRETVKLY